MKRLFIVFIVILLFFVTGCQGITPANTEIIECTESIFHSIDDLANTNAVKGTDIVKASADEPDDFIIPSANHSLTNQEYDKYDGIETQGMHDSNDNRDGTDSEEG